ncbi:Fe-S protein assembly co-chaperone HscB [Sansalvadorimonas sp. 2012CJ34-2]|uniref:Co-chaperone protein HscB homolog n=1 Tax=Parendozoicomonas callyspongiae TaxID=2942213 RepID=A0ABT0PCS9_9GAMM|nr:Fe-S protein assembly co-chaperone HscB [Sansalvadorimonas sp. 2012CJ34-2]MCL6269026.1 Fe-S protein assembly co-chaperone HscB [Sansalvadorimonas sp. 2012CJ34-2]
MSDIPAGIDLTASYFELFGMEAGYDINRDAIQDRYLDLQRIVHPDRFAGLGERGQRLAVQYAAFVNEAYQTLCSPLKRALYLLEHSGHPVDIEKNTVMDTGFLMQQLELREELGEVRESCDPESAIEAVLEHAEELMTSLQLGFVTCWKSGTADDLEKAADFARKMHFAEKLISEAEELEEQLFDS